ncbi:MAG: hypothetical protein AAB373_04260 [Patescibacteria group bacterium]
MEDSSLKSRFESLRNLVLAKRPILKEILKKRGDKALLDYANQYVDINLSPTIPKRQIELLETMYEIVSGRYGKEIASSVINQLEKYYFVSTADHIGPINHPYFINSDLLIEASMASHSDPLLKNIVVLGCANVSFNNSSFPRGLFFHTYKNGFQLHKLPILSAKPTPHTIYAMPPYGEDAIKKVFEFLNTKIENKEVDKKVGDEIYQIFRDIYLNSEILAAKSYCDQIGKTNLLLWQKFFEKSGVKLPNLIHIEQEEVVVKLLIKYHLNQDTILNHMLFDPNYEPYINDYFEGIFGSFSRKDTKGTYLFWALPEGHRDPLQLWREKNYLVSQDGSYRIELKPEVIKDAMERKELIPGLLLNFCTLSFYYGLKCLGGFNQVNYLTLMKNAYIKMNAELGNYRSIEICARAQTKEICDGPSMAFLGHSKENEPILASGLDLALYGDKDSWKKLIKVTKKLTLAESLNPLMPEIYRISYDEKDWDQDLITIKEKEIAELLGLAQKITPCVTIPDTES